MIPAVSAKHVCFSYQDIPVLSDVTLTIAEGSFVGIVGPNGGGKTTLLKLIMGFIKPTSGEILVFGKSPQETQSSIAYVPQTLHFDKQLPISVEEVVLTGRLSHLSWYGHYSKNDKQIAHDVLERVGLVDFRHKAFGTLSGGQRQRALIARALVAQPRLLLLDEPTANIDAKAETDLYALLPKLRGSMTILMVTHNLRAAIELVEQVLCIQQGVMYLKPTEVCEHLAIGLYHPSQNQSKRIS